MLVKSVHKVQEIIDSIPSKRITLGDNTVNFTKQKHL